MVAIVTHHENVIVRHRDFGEIVEFLGLVVDHQIGRPIGERFAHHRYAADGRTRGVLRAEIVEAEAIAARIGIERQRDGRLDLLFDRRAIEDDASVLHRDPVTGQRNHPLDVILVALGMNGNDDIAIFGRRSGNSPVTARGEVEADRAPVPAIGIFAHHQPVAHQQVRHHRFRRDVERFGDEAVKGEHREQHHGQPADFGDPVDLVVGCVGFGFHCCRAAGHWGRASMMT